MTTTRPPVRVFSVAALNEVLNDCIAATLRQGPAREDDAVSAALTFMGLMDGAYPGMSRMLAAAAIVRFAQQEGPR